MSSNVTLLPSTQGVVNVTGTPIRGAGSTRTVGSLYTVVVTANNLQGRVFIEGSIAAYPTEDDWFSIIMPDNDSPYIEFPFDGGNTVGNVTTVGFNFKGNFTWLRARLDRDYLGLENLTSPTELIPYGYVDNIVLNVGGWSSVNALSGDYSGGPVYSGVSSVTATNIGTGLGLFANSIGQSNVLLNFKSLIAGNGVVLTSNSTALTISTRTGESGVTRFIDLDDAPTDIVPNAIVYGGNDSKLHFSPQANAVSNAVLLYSNNQFVWKNFYQEIANSVSDSAWELEIQNNGANVSTNTKTLNFTGAVSVTSNSTQSTINVGSIGNHVEWVEFLYTPGRDGVFDSSSLIANSAGVTANIIDGETCTTEFIFSGHTLPPTSIALIGQRVGVSPVPTTFSYQNIHPTLGARIDAETVADLMTGFNGPITLPLTMGETNSYAPLGQRASLIVMFGF